LSGVRAIHRISFRQANLEAIRGAGIAAGLESRRPTTGLGIALQEICRNGRARYSIMIKFFSDCARTKADGYSQG